MEMLSDYEKDLIAGISPRDIPSFTDADYEEVKDEIATDALGYTIPAAGCPYPFKITYLFGEELENRLYLEGYMDIPYRYSEGNYYTPDYLEYHGVIHLKDWHCEDKDGNPMPCGFNPRVINGAWYELEEVAGPWNKASYL